VDSKPTHSPSESAKDQSSSGPTLGQLLTAAREKLGVSRQEAAHRAHLSLSYVEMLEGESYKKVSDQIYLVPFLRRYASTLGLDGEDLAMRFVRDFQYLENESARMAEPVILESKRSGRRYSWLAIAGAALAAIALAKFGQSYYREQSPAPSTRPQPSSMSGTVAGQPARDRLQAGQAAGGSPVANQSAPLAAQPPSSKPMGSGPASSSQRTVSSGEGSEAVSASKRAAAANGSANEPSDSSPRSDDDSAGTE
jgi:cytoskeleton protein RodZ